MFLKLSKLSSTGMLLEEEEGATGYTCLVAKQPVEFLQVLASDINCYGGYRLADPRQFQ